MILDFGSGRIEEMETPDTVDEIEICPELAKLGAWASESLKGVSQRHSIVKQLEGANWAVDSVTQPLFDQLKTEVEKYKGKPFGNKPMDFYDWIKLPSVRAQLPANTFDLIKDSPDAVLEAAMLRRARLQSDQKASVAAVDEDENSLVAGSELRSDSDDGKAKLTGPKSRGVMGIRPVLGMRSGLDGQSSILRLELERSDSTEGTKGVSDGSVNPDVSVAVSPAQPSDDKDTGKHLKP